MSTRCTIAYDENFHLYQECFENDNVYLTLEGKGWAADIETASVDWRDGDNASPAAHIRIDITMWRKIVDGWNASKWANDTSYDHKQFEIDTTFLESLTKKQKEADNDDMKKCDVE